jgi:predicted adenylyl cyclase CyaB
VQIFDEKGKEVSEFLEIEYKYNADDIDRLKFKDLVQSFGPKSFIYVESKDIYYVRSGDDFLRYRMPPNNKCGEDNRAELTFKRKHVDQNNWTRTEVNLRVDQNDPKLVEAFVEGLGYKKSFEITKLCDIFYFADADLVYYSVKSEDGKYSHFIEIECLEGVMGQTQETASGTIQKYEKMLLPLGITPQKRKKLSLWELYK